MFHSARIKLTVWYLLIIMAISLVFSAVIYSTTNMEFRRFERMQVRVLEERELGVIPSIRTVPNPRLGRINPKEINEARMRLLAYLGLINLAILVMAGGAGYFLAGRTLSPIAEMVDEQNRFITDASHELRTPITVLKSEIEVGMRDKSLNLQTAKKILSSNLEEVNYLQVLSDNLIKLAQNKKGNGMSFEKVSVGTVAKEAIIKVKKIADSKNIKIINSIKDTYLNADQQSLIELFVILLDNAIKYSPAKSSVSLTSQKSKESVVIKIADNGIGIAKEDQRRIFERFFRAEKSRTENGYGLGLSIAKQIVEMNRGTIDVDSDLKKGTTFILSFQLN
ncbi:MAG TPA: HAMP domain-containing sensor histidine kinase [Candidatus Saccharimonadales bacterium]|nr:HAMP domain-containing sensor histidine kinase [Candidatus Saccharimonadales bacterium]